MAGISSKAAGKLENKRKFNGIEHNTDLDLNQYDAFFRNADPQIGRWWQIDPKPNTSESPYSMMGNNPISKADPLGDTIKARGNFLQRLKINARLLIASTFSSSAREMIRDLKKSTHVHTIVMNKYIDASFSRPDNIAAALKKGTVFETQDQFGATTIMGTGLGTGTTITLAKRNKHQDINGGYTGTRTTALLHELFHSWSYNYGKGNREIDNSLKVEERQAVHWENVFRKQLGFLGIFGMPARAAYEDETNVMQNVYDPNFEQKANESDPRKN
ncbi:MAG TPA: RHS repeat-associated core domain-containing protein, partial [Methanosarcina sp.]|nr:RHS repeat-associated core domain-containing protein [Methanosarcina sp.]